MDESWRMRMGMPEKLPNYPRRRSTDEDDDPLNPENFKDVFGGPPRTILSRQFTTGLGSSSSTSSSSSSCLLYDRVYSSTQARFEGNGKGNSNVYDDILYGWDDQSVSMRSRTRSKASSSSVLSSEELSPLRFNRRVQDDASLLASRLRQIDVYSGWNPKKTQHENHKSPPFFTERSIRKYPFGSGRRTAYPETVSPKLTFIKTSFNVSADDLHLNSPSSPVSSVCLSDQEGRTCEIEDGISMQSTIEDEPTKAYDTEMNPRNRAVASELDYVDEAVQWMKEKFQAQCLDIEHKLNS